jgi:O-antigen/teichoic acid export membrane protein
VYVSASVAASAALWLPYNVTASTYARLSTEAIEPGSDDRSFRLGLGATGVMVFALVCVLEAAPALIIRILFGPAYAGAASVLVWLACSNGLQGLCGYLMAHQLAHRSRTVLLSWAGVAALAIGMSSHHGSSHQVATVAVTVSAALAVAMLLASVGIRASGRRCR